MKFFIDLFCRLILSANLDEEEDAEEVTRKQEGTSAGAGQSYSAEKSVVSGKGTETPEKKKPEDAGQQNAEIPVGAQMQAEKSEEKAGAVGEEKREAPKEEKREPPKEEKKAKSVTRFTYVLPPQAKKPDARFVADSEIILYSCKYFLCYALIFNCTIFCYFLVHDDDGRNVTKNDACALMKIKG